VPDDDARTAIVLWRPDVCRHVLPLIARLAASHAPEAIRLLDIPCRSTLLVLPGGAQHLLFHAAGRSLQLVVSGASIISPVRLLTAAVLERGSMMARLNALQCFNDLHRSGRLGARHFPPERRGRRLRVVLQALDGRIAGASQREIALALFGRRRVELDWADPRSHLRDHVRRAVARGLALSAGLYRQFLS